jgi:hypothetical protein
MNGFLGYGIACLAILAILIVCVRTLENLLFRSLVFIASVTSPMWVGLLGIGVFGSDTFGVSYSRFAEEWTWAWGLSHMMFLAPMIVSFILTTAFAGPFKKLKSSKFFEDSFDLTHK